MSARSFRLDDFSPASRGWTPLFLDTSALFAYFNPAALEYRITREFFSSLTGDDPEFPYGPLYTNTYVIDELATGLLSQRSHSVAADALEHVFLLAEDGMVEILTENDDVLSQTRRTFHRYDDHEISFTDHMITVHADRRNVDHVLTYDGDFRTLGLTVVPHAT